MIPKTLHIIWVGDESKRPDNCIATWRDLNPSWNLIVWGNQSLKERAWINGAHMIQMSEREFNGVADMMRWEILFEHGGVVVDADSICVRPLDDDLLDCEAFTCWESEIARPGLLAAGYFGSVAKNPFVGQIILNIHKQDTVVDRMAWESVGPKLLTDTFIAERYHGLRIYPSHYFIPEHFSGVIYKGEGRVYAHQLWGSTRDIYDQIHRERIAPAEATAETPAAAPASAGPRPVSVLERQHDPYFVQKVNVSSELVGRNRVDALRAFCKGKRVIHIGCADWPITDPAASLHLALQDVCAKLDGFDIHEDALAALAPHVTGRLYSRFDQIVDAYDIVLVPEVMEHVDDVAGFLRELDTLNAAQVLMSVPDAFQCRSRHFDYVSGVDTFVEVVHPDHNCWYTPYTFANTLRKYTSWSLNKMWFFNNISLLALLSMREERALAA